MASRRSNKERNDKAVKREALKRKSSSSIRKKHRVSQPQKTSNGTLALYAQSSSLLKDNSLSPSSSNTTYTTVTAAPLKSTTTTPPSTSVTSSSTTTMPDIRTGRRKPNTHPAAFLEKLAYLSQSLRPFISVTTGQAHPSFPDTLLAFHLLTPAQLDSLVAHYHQFVPPVHETSCYPVKIPSWVDRAGRPLLDVPLETKRMLFAQFIGLVSAENMVEEEQVMLLAMEREWQEALARARREDEDRDVLRKIGGRF